MTAEATTVRPESVDALRSAVLDHPGTIAVRGAGTAADWAGTPAPADVVVDTTALRGIVTHNPGDMTVEVRAGTPLDALQSELGEHAQRVAIDPVRAAQGATLGGVFATADSGPRALQYGSLRDLVIGATIVLADGTVARTGGHVIKNVAGYDLTKLLHGAHGTLGIVATLVLRLHPVPAAAATVAVPCDRAGLPDVARAVADSPVEAAAVQWRDGRLLALLEGSADGVAARARRLAETLDGAGILDDDDARAAWEAQAQAVGRRDHHHAVLRLGVTPSRLPAVLDELPDCSDAVVSPRTGVATVALDADADTVADAHRVVSAAGGTSTLRQRPAGSDLPGLGPAPSSAPVLRAVAANLDPDQRLGRGRLAPWIPHPEHHGAPNGVSA